MSGADWPSGGSGIARWALAQVGPQNAHKRARRALCTGDNRLKRVERGKRADAAACSNKSCFPKDLWHNVNLGP